MADFPFQGNPEDLAEQEASAILQENPDSTSLMPASPDEMLLAGEANPSEVPVQEASSTEDTPHEEQGLSKEAQDALMRLVDDYEREDDESRAAYLREWKLMEHFWNDNQHNVWSEIAQDWRPIESYGADDDLDLEGFEPKTVNIYKAHGESVIAAMSTGVPVVRFFPDDADSQDDIATAKVYSHASELIQRRNKAFLILIKVLYTLWNQGFAGAYNFSRKEPKLGTVVQPLVGMMKNKKKDVYCENCATDLPDVPSAQCPNCDYIGPPVVDEYEEEIPGVVGQEEHVRINEEIRVYSPLFFRIPYRATAQDECSYLTLDTEQDAGSVINTFLETIPDIRDKIQPTTDDTKYDRWARNLTNQISLPNLVTVRQRWVRNWALHNIGDEAARNELLQKFPNGVYFIQAGEEFLVAVDENLDDHWTITINPTSPHIVTKASGASLKQIQEMTNELVTMTLDNIEHGTPMTFMDSEILNIRKFKDSRTAPGMVYPVKVPPGSNLSNYVHETRPATLSEEVRHFEEGLREYGQFVSGAFPSIYGGVIAGGSGTAKEYEQSRAQALQRLQITWRTVNEFWVELISKATKDYLQNLTYDERFVKPQGNSGFINVWIRKSDITGKIGEVIPESSESFPLSSAQKRDVLMSFLQMKNPMLEAALFHPENVSLLAQTVGFPDIYIPGDDDRSKQLNELAELLAGQPVPSMDPASGQPIMMPSVMPDTEVDNHPVHMQTIQAFAVSEVGQQVMKENPMGYQNMIAHFKMHEQAMMISNIKQAVRGGDNEQAPDVPAPKENQNA